MANSLSASFPEFFSRRMQRRHYKSDVYRAQANFEEEATLKKGDKVTRPYRSALNVVTYTRGTAVTIQDITDTEEYLEVQTSKIVPFYVDDLDALQSNYKTQMEYADDCAKYLGNWIDGDYLAEVANAGNIVDDGTLGGTTGNGIAVTTSNIQSVFSKISMKMNQQKVAQDSRFVNVGPNFYATLLDYLAGKETQLGDSTGVNGHIGKYYGFDLYMTNSSYWTAKLEIGTNPSDTNTVVLNGVTFTFRTTQGSLAGSVNICSDTAHTITNFVAFLNAPSTTVAESTDAGYNAITAANQILLSGLTATASTAYLTLAVKGADYWVVSETIADGSFTTGLQIQHLLAGRKGNVDMVVQKYPNVEVKDVQDKLGKNILPWTLYGKKTFAEGAVEMVDVKVLTSSY